MLIDYRPALRERTGVGEYAHRLAAALVAQLPPGDALTLFSSSWKDRLAADVIPGAAVVDARVPVRLLNLAWHRLGWPPIESITGSSYDVVQSSHPLLVPSRGAAAFVTIHDLDFLDHPERARAEIRRDYPRLAADHARRADGIVVSSAYTRDNVIARFGVPRERVVLCPAGAPAWEPRTEPPPGGPILFLGTIEARKNVEGLVAAYERLLAAAPDAPDLVLAGRIPPGAESLIRADPGVSARIQLRGYVSDDDRMRLYRSAAMLVLPSFEEGFGLPVLEAMTLGIPVIVSNRGSLPELAGDAAAIVDPDDRGALAETMRRVLSDAPFRRRLADAGPKRAAAFSWRISAARLLDAYRAALERRRSRA
jgi:glycosyltransferase involved in cell wall biosynthesis